jgi:hypothetical protein
MHMDSLAEMTFKSKSLWILLGISFVLFILYFFVFAWAITVSFSSNYIQPYLMVSLR